MSEAVALSFRAEWGRLVATLIRSTGDWDLAEECAQDAFARALRSWPRDGVPQRPGAWLTTVARNRAMDRLRRSTLEAARLWEMAAVPDTPGPGAAPGDSAAPDSTPRSRSRGRARTSCRRPSRRAT